MSLYSLGHIFSSQLHTQEAEAGKVYEAAIGIVTDNKDPQKIGRVRVKVPILSDTDQSWWAPLIMLGAGKNRGWFFIPEVNDEVILMFEHGSADHPLVLGQLWNGKDKPSDKNPGGNPRRVIKSRAGSKITFDDDKLLLTLEDGGGKGKITFDSNANKITIEAIDGDVCFQAPKDLIQIVAKTMEVSATKNMEVYAGSTMAWGTDAGVTVKGQDVTISGAKANDNCGTSTAPQAPTATPADVADPYGS
jgi:uncharacterized protein involved in type VI secretion and phage assembly